MSDKPVPKPRVDEQGVPRCDGDDCPAYKHAMDCADWCRLTQRRTYLGDTCLPAVRAMARDLAEARAERDVAMLKQRHAIGGEAHTAGLFRDYQASCEARAKRLEQELSEARAEAMTARGRLEVVGLGYLAMPDWTLPALEGLVGRDGIDDNDPDRHAKAMAKLDKAYAALVKAGVIKEETP